MQPRFRYPFFPSIMANLTATPARMAKALNWRDTKINQAPSNSAGLLKHTDQVTNFSSLTPGIGATKQPRRSLPNGLNWHGARSTMERMLDTTQVMRRHGLRFA